LPRGVATHDPIILESIEDQNWDVDFFMACFYNHNRTGGELKQALGGQATVGETYVASDPARMCKAIYQSRKTCLAFKILAAGRIESPAAVDEAFKFAFAHIKPRDAVIIGVYPRFTDHVADNADRVRRILVPPKNGTEINTD
jgi:hypothetical protein